MSMPKINTKIAWSGLVLAIQPRIRLTRSFDQRHHGYYGFVLRMNSIYGDQSGEFTVGVGKGAHEKCRFHVGMELSGVSIPVEDPRLETAGLYKTSGIKVERDPGVGSSLTPPFLGIPPTLEVYRSRGHRRLDPRTYESKCVTCMWGCNMPVEMILDQWDPSKKKYRFETFCYGPKSCSFCRAGATRKVPGRRGMTWEEEDWVDEEATAHRGADE